MPKLASEALLREKKTPVTKCYSQPGLTNPLLSGQIWYVLLRGSLNFCSCTTWFLDLNDSVGINRAWLQKEPKVSVLHVNPHLAQKGECLTWNQRLIRGLGGNILLLNVLLPISSSFLKSRFTELVCLLLPLHATTCLSGINVVQYFR